MALDRSKYAPMKKSAIEAQQKEATETAGVQQGNGGGRLDFLKITEGANKFRIFPAHSPEDSFAEPSCKVFLTCSVPKRDPQTFVVLKDNKGEVITEQKNVPIFNSKTHAGTKFDLVEEYIRIATDIFNEKYSKEEAAKRIKALSHFKLGIAPKLSWVMYALKLTKGNAEFGRLEISNGVKQQLNALATTEDPEDVVDVDPFSDLDGGRPFLLQYNKGENVKPQDVYKATLAPDARPISDEQLEKFEKQPSLKELYRGVFKRKDLERQIEGLYNYDQLNKIGVYEHDEWQKLMDDQLALFPEEDEDEQDTKSAKKTTNSPISSTKPAPAPAEEEEEEEEEEDEDPNDLATCGRDMLKRINKEEGLGVVVTSSKTDSVLRQEIATARSASKNKSKVTNDDEDEETTGDEKPAKGAGRLQNLRKRSE